MKYLLAIVFANFLIFNTLNAQIKCGTDEILKNNPKLKLELDRLDGISQKNKKAKTNAEVIPDNISIYTIPVVFHIFHKGEAEGVGSNVSVQNIQATMQSLNDAFRAGGAFAGITPDVRIQFVLASRTPNCLATNGIVRVDGRVIAGYEANGLAYGDDAAKDAFRELSSWPNSHYINIRVFHTITGTGGFAYFLNDLFMPASSIGANDAEFWAHEMGHSMNLYHTFEGDGGNQNCPNNGNPEMDGDRVSDTDPHLRDEGQIPNVCDFSNILNECTNTNFGSLLNNIMSYSWCPRLFTPLQVYRMRYALVNYRASLINSLGKTPPDGNQNPAIACAVTATNGLSAYFGISNFTFGNIQYNGSNSADLGTNYQDLTCLSQTDLTIGTAKPFQIESTYGNSQYAKIFIDYNNDGDFFDLNELIYNGSNALANHSGNISPSNTALLNTKLRMRVMMDDNIMTACNLPGSVEYKSGLAVDFTVKILSNNCVMATTKSGSWNDPTVWTCNRLPLATDAITIAANHLITVPSGMFHVKNIILNGIIQYNQGGEIILNEGN